MITASELIELLKHIPLDSRLYAYSGDAGNGLRVSWGSPLDSGPPYRGWIETGGDYEKFTPVDPSKHQLGDVISGADNS